MNKMGRLLERSSGPQSVMVGGDCGGFDRDCVRVMPRCACTDARYKAYNAPSCTPPLHSRHHPVIYHPCKINQPASQRRGRPISLKE